MIELLVDAAFRSGCHRTMEISLFKGQVWLRHGVSCLCLTVSIGILFLHYLDDLPTLKRLINILSLKGLAQCQ